MHSLSTTLYNLRRGVFAAFVCVALYWFWYDERGVMLVGIAQLLAHGNISGAGMLTTLLVSGYLFLTAACTDWMVVAAATFAIIVPPVCVLRRCACAGGVQEEYIEI